MPSLENGFDENGNPADGPSEHGTIRERLPSATERFREPSSSTSGPSAKERAERAEQTLNRIDSSFREPRASGEIERARPGAGPTKVDNSPKQASRPRWEFGVSAGSGGFAQFLMLPAVGVQAMAGARSSGAVEGYAGVFVGAGGLGAAFFLPGPTATVSWGVPVTQSGFSAACQPAAVVSIAIFQVTITTDSDLQADSVSISASEGLGLGVVAGVYCGMAVRYSPFF